MPVMSRGFAQLQAIQYEMQKDPKMVYVLQGAIASATRADGKSINFNDEFGWARSGSIRGSPIDEKWMVGSCIGAALSGHKAVVQPPAMCHYFVLEEIWNQAGKLSHATGGGGSCPAVFWISGSGRGVGSGAMHCEAGHEAVYANLPGLKVVVPNTVYDAKGLMHAAIRDGGPVVYVDYVTEASADVPDEPYVVPIGKAAVRQEGKDITIATWPPANVEVQAALKTLVTAGISYEYIDVRSVKPFDEETLVKSVKKTGRLLVVTHGYYTNGFAGHVIAVAAQEVPGAKFRMITWPDVGTPASAILVAWLMPDAAKIVDAVNKLLRA